MDISDAGASSTDQRMASLSDMNDADDTNDETRSFFFFFFSTQKFGSTNELMLHETNVN